jgi:flagellar biosynthesis/type III secretory pathway protein FliH
MNRQAYLYALVEKYLPLTPAERITHNARIKELEETNVEAVMTEWQRENYEKGLSQGLSQGSTQTAQQSLLLVLETRLGMVPTSVRERVAALSDLAELQRLLRIAVVAPSLDEFGKN